MWKIARALESVSGLLYIVAKFHELWSTNGSKPDRRFYFTYPHYLLYD